jgi:hypothetical protein
VLITGCSSSPGDVRAEGAPLTERSPAGQTGRTAEDAATGAGKDDGVQYASCMRENGVDVADPDASSGLVVLPPGLPQGQVKRAEAVCGTNPTGQTLRGDIPPPEVRSHPDVEALRLKYLSCLRENGHTPPKMVNGTAVIKATPELLAAQKACRAENEALDQRRKELMEKAEQ